MSMIEELMADKKKAAIYGGVVGVCLLGALYFLFGSSGTPVTEQDSAAIKQAEEIQKQIDAAPPEAAEGVPVVPATAKRGLSTGK